MKNCCIEIIDVELYDIWMVDIFLLKQNYWLNPEFCESFQIMIHVIILFSF